MPEFRCLNGRYGPYITDKSRNAKIPKDKEPKSLTLEECQALLAAAPVRTFGKWGRKGAKAPKLRRQGSAATLQSGAPAAAGAPARRRQACREGHEGGGQQDRRRRPAASSRRSQAPAKAEAKAKPSRPRRVPQERRP